MSAVDMNHMKFNADCEKWWIAREWWKNGLFMTYLKHGRGSVMTWQPLDCDTSALIHPM